MAGKANHRRMRPPATDSPSPANPNPASAPAPALARRQPMILKDRPARPAAQFAEVAGGVAGCAAICCCCPCGLVNLLVLAVVRLPAGLCRKALQKQRMKRRVAVAGKKNGGLLVPRPDVDKKAGAAAMHHVAVAEGWPGRGAPAEVAEIERKMCAEFYSTGFWRSLSQ